MKKNFKFMLVALLAMFGFSNASAQFSVGGNINKGYYSYNVNAINNTAKTATVTLTGWTADPTQADGSLTLPGTFQWEEGINTYTVSVTAIADRNELLPQSAVTNVSNATSVVIPKEIVTIGIGAFYGCSALTSITFEEGSKVETIGSNAFATTKITDFDFSPCTSLQGLETEVFVQPSLNNTYITKVTLPTGPLFKHIGKAFQNLTNLAEIENLDQSYVQEIVAEAFKGCGKLETLSLPGKNLQYIDMAALELSSVKNLSIDVSKLIKLGGCTVDPDTYVASDASATTNLYNKNAINVTPLQSLTLTGTLTGKICAYAFGYCDKIDAVLDLTGVTFGSTAQVEANAFTTCYNPAGSKKGIRGVKVGDITDNQSGDYTFAAGAFAGCTLLESVEIGNITTAKAIGAAAFGDQLKSVKIGTVKADDAAFQAGAFVWKKVSGASLELAQGEGEYLNANNITKNIIPAGVFDMSAITGLAATDVWPVIKIGEIRSLGGVFEDGAVTVAAASEISELTFTGAIAANGLDAKLINVANYTGIKKITFKGAIGAAGIATDAFANLECTNGLTLDFEGLLAEGAVAAGAFELTETTGKSYVVNYKYNNIPDYTVNPFNIKAFNSTAEYLTDRFIVLNVTDKNLKANFADEVKGIKGSGTDTNKFDVYIVKAIVTADDATTFLVYQNGTSNIAWGRYDLGSFTVEQGPDPLNPYSVTNGMIIPRYQDITFGEGESATTARVKLTLYGTYGDENENGGVEGDGESLVYMVPLQVFNGNYEIAQTNAKTIIIKAEAISGSFAEKDINIAYTDPDAAPTNNSVWATLPDFGAARAFNKNQTTNVITTQILWDGTDQTNYDVWGDADPDNIDHTQAYAPYAIYSISNPANYKGIDVVKLMVSATSGKIGLNWYYMFMRHFGDTSAAARVVWLNEAEATAIFGTKTQAKAAVEDGVMYNLQGVRISAPQKGQLYIMNGKKYIGR